MRSGGSDFKAIGGELCPIGSGDSGAVCNSGESGCGSGGLVEALCALEGTGFYDDAALTSIACGGSHIEHLQYGLAAVVVDCVGLLVQYEAIVDETTLSCVTV